MSFFISAPNYPDSNGGLNGLITRTECIYKKKEKTSRFSLLYPLRGYNVLGFMRL